MKHGLRPTKKQKVSMKASGLNPDNWLIYKKTHDTLSLTHRETGAKKTILV